MEESHSDKDSDADIDSEDSEPELINRDIIVSLWRGTTEKVKVKAIMRMKDIG